MTPAAAPEVPPMSDERTDYDEAIDEAIGALIEDSESFSLSVSGPDGEIQTLSANRGELDVDARLEHIYSMCKSLSLLGDAVDRDMTPEEIARVAIYYGEQSQALDGAALEFEGGRNE